MSKVVDRFLRYVRFNTASQEESTVVPSTKGQLSLAQALAAELKAVGLEEVSVDNRSYVYATLPANVGFDVPTIGFIAHLDTSPEISGDGVNPQIVENYNGSDLVLNQAKGIVMSVKEFPELKNYLGQTLITTDGTTLLGADDKAGIAEIITAIEYLVEHPEIPHGRIRICFTPDEEVGRGADFFDVQKFRADFAYTVDGGPIGELEYENFNAAKAKITIHGRNIHTGSAKGIMINSLLLAAEFIALLPKHETPADTEGYEGFYHLNDLQGGVEQTVFHYLIRDFDTSSFQARKNAILAIGQTLNQTYGEKTVSIELKDQYYNMRTKIEPVKHIVDLAVQAMEAVGVTPLIKPIRGGTDGARLSYMGLPTPNLFSGGHNFHGMYEFVPTFALEKAVEVIVKITELSTKRVR